MPRQNIPRNVSVAHPIAGGQAQAQIGLALTAVATTQASGSAVDLSAGDLTDPPANRAPRGLRFALSSGGTAGTYTITGTWSGKTVTEEVTTVADNSVDGLQPFDELISITGPDPGADLDITLGLVLPEPHARAVWTGPTGGELNVQLSAEDATKVGPTLPANIDWQRWIKAIDPTGTTIPDGEAWLVW